MNLNTVCLIVSSIHVLFLIISNTRDKSMQSFEAVFIVLLTIGSWTTLWYSQNKLQDMKLIQEIILKIHCCVIGISSDVTGAIILSSLQLYLDIRTGQNFYFYGNLTRFILQFLLTFNFSSVLLLISSFVFHVLN